MPLLEVWVVEDPRQALPAGAAQALADAVGPALGSAPGHTWVRLQRVAAADYAEQQAAVAGAPVFIELGLRGLVDDAAELLQRLTPLAAQALGRAPEWVHLRLLPPLGGRQAFGGRWVPPLES